MIQFREVETCRREGRYTNWQYTNHYFNVGEITKSKSKHYNFCSNGLCIVRASSYEPYHTYWIDSRCYVQSEAATILAIRFNLFRFNLKGYSRKKVDIDKKECYLYSTPKYDLAIIWPDFTIELPYPSKIKTGSLKEAEGRVEEEIVKLEEAIKKDIQNELNAA